MEPELEIKSKLRTLMEHGQGMNEPTYRATIEEIIRDFDSLLECLGAETQDRVDRVE